MGMVDFLFTRKPDPLVEVMKEMIALNREQADQHNKLMIQVLDVQKDQSQTSQKLLDMYLNPAMNTTTSLDERMANRAKNDEWDPLDFMPFQELMHADD